MFILAPDPCAPHPCDVNANCTKLGVSGDFICTCIFPYSGNGIICTGKESQQLNLKTILGASKQWYMGSYNPSMGYMTPKGT